MVTGFVWRRGAGCRVCASPLLSKWCSARLREPVHVWMGELVLIFVMHRRETLSSSLPLKPSLLCVLLAMLGPWLHETQRWSGFVCEEVPTPSIGNGERDDDHLPLTTR